jgi:uncharacterized protein
LNIYFIMREKLFFKNRRQIKLCGILSDSSEDKKRPVIILAHGFSTGKGGKTYVSLEEILNKKEISTFRFDFYGHGESEGFFENITTSRAVDDVLAAFKFLKGLGYRKIGLMGSSFGGMVSILAAAQSNPYILALKSPVSDYKKVPLTKKGEDEIQDWKKKGVIEIESVNHERRLLSYAFFEDAVKINAYESARGITVPTLIVHGRADKIVPVEQSQRLAGLIQNCRLEIIEGCDHTYSNPAHFKQLLVFISRFIGENS